MTLQQAVLAAYQDLKSVLVIRPVTWRGRALVWERPQYRFVSWPWDSLRGPVQAPFPEPMDVLVDWEAVSREQVQGELREGSRL